MIIATMIAASSPLVHVGGELDPARVGSGRTFCGIAAWLPYKIPLANVNCGECRRTLEREWPVLG